MLLFLPYPILLPLSFLSFYAFTPEILLRIWERYKLMQRVQVEADRQRAIVLETAKQCNFTECLTDNCRVHNRLIMAALRSRCGYYIFALWFLLSFFPRLISAAVDWMSTILRHMVWP